MRKKIYSISGLIIVLILSVSIIMLLSACGKSSEDAAIDEYNSHFEMSTEYVNVSINTAEIFHDQADKFMNPLEPTDKDNVTVRLRTYRGNITKANLEFTVEISKINTETATWNSIPMIFERCDETKTYDYWIAIIPAQNSPYKYHFKVENNKQVVYYNYFDVGKEKESEFDSDIKINPIDASSDYYIMPNFATPDWSKGTVWYSIMPDSFYNGDVLNDKTNTSVFIQSTWGTTHTSGLSYFGGDLLGIENKINHFNELNINSVFINPINLAYHNAGYGALDLLQVDSSLGNDNMLTRLVNKLHSNDMKLMLDGVFTYFSFGSVYYNNDNTFPFGGAVNIDDEYYEMFIRGSNGELAKLVWNSPRVDFSSKIARETVYSSASSIMQYYILNCGIDGWRLDVGGDLYGSKSGQWSTPTQIIKDMRRYLKNIDKNVLLCSEGGSGTMLTDYALDTMWNFDYYYAVQTWLEDTTDASSVEQLNRSLYNTVMSLPRQIANSSYNFTANHDFPRTLVSAKEDIAKTLATTLVNMTFTGAPCIYFGDEIGMDGKAFFDSMKWDKSEWNYEIFNYYKALTQLRKEFSDLYKDGVSKDLGIIGVDDKSLLSFGRWKGNDKAITVMNAYDETLMGAKINVRQLEIADGTMLYDYLSGKSYTVEDGNVTIDVIKGGAVLVNRKTNSWAGMFDVEKIGESEAVIINDNEGAFSVSGIGTISDISDNFTFAYLPIFNNYELNFNVVTGQGSYALMFRNSLEKDSAFYSVQIDSSGLAKVIYRKEDGLSIVTANLGTFVNGSKLKIVRSSNNSFYVCKLIDEEYIKITTESVYVELKTEAIAGLLPISGQTSVSNVKLSALNKQLYSTFNTSTDSLMFNEGNGVIKRENGVLVLNPNKDKLVAQISQSPTKDFSVKALIKSVPLLNGCYNAVTVYQSENSYIIAGRYHIDNKSKIIFALVINGIVSVYDEVEDVSGDVLIQIEKTGAYYAARYSTGDEDFKLIGENMLANFSEIYSGCISYGGIGIFDDFCYGDSINDEESYSAHAYYGYLDISMEQVNYVKTQVHYTTSGGIWEYQTGAVAQTLISAGKTSFSPGNIDYKSFKADFTLSIEEAINENSYVSFVFGISGNSEYRVSLNSTGLVKLFSGTTEFGEYQIQSFSYSQQYRFLIISNQEGKINVYMYENPILIIEANDTGYINGNMMIEGYKAVYKIMSYNFYHYSSNWWLSSTAQGTISTQGQYMILTASPTISASVVGCGMSDFIFSANVTMQKTYSKKAIFGLSLDSTVGATTSQDGLFLSIDSNKVLNISKNDESLHSVTLDINYESFYLIVAVQNNTMYVYVDKYQSGYENGYTNGSNTPILTYEIGKSIGGSININASYSTIILSKLRIYGLKNNENYKNLELFTDRSCESPYLSSMSYENAFAAQSTNSFIFDFSDKNQIIDFQKYSGAWYINSETEELYGLGKYNWTCGTTITYGYFEDYELNYKINCKGNTNWAGLLINKDLPKDTHNDSGYLFYTNADGKSVFNTIDSGLSGSGLLDEDGYLAVKIKSYTNSNSIGVISVTIGGITNNYYNVDVSGYISIVAGNCVASYKDISIYKINSNGIRV